MSMQVPTYDDPLDWVLFDINKQPVESDEFVGANHLAQQPVINNDYFGDDERSVHSSESFVITGEERALSRGGESDSGRVSPVSGNLDYLDLPHTSFGQKSRLRTFSDSALICRPISCTPPTTISDQIDSTHESSAESRASTQSDLMGKRIRVIEADDSRIFSNRDVGIATLVSLNVQLENEVAHGNQACAESLAFTSKILHKITKNITHLENLEKRISGARRGDKRNTLNLLKKVHAERLAAQLTLLPLNLQVIQDLLRKTS